MAKTAAFGADNVLINVYDSGKAAKAAHKGEKDVIFATAANFAELNTDSRFVNEDGKILTVDVLFPVAEKAATAEGGEKKERAPRQHVKMEGEYHVIKNNGARFAVEDERGALHEALVGNNTCEAYLAVAPEKVNFTSSRGAAQTCTAKTYFSYALKRGWIGMGPAPVAAEASEEAAEASEEAASDEQETADAE